MPLSRGIYRTIRGGGVYSSGTHGQVAVELLNVTLTRNTAEHGTVTAGGGLWLLGTAFTLHNAIVAGNFGGAVDAAESSEIHLEGGANTIDAQYSLFGDPGSTPAAIQDGQDGNIVGKNGGKERLPISAILAPLADNGGPTLTHALIAGSPAIDKGKQSLAVDANNQPLLTDQRGLLRTFDVLSVPNAVEGLGTDIGAFEFQGPLLPVVGGTFTLGTTNGQFVILDNNGTPILTQPIGNTILSLIGSPQTDQLIVDASQLPLGTTLSFIAGEGDADAATILNGGLIQSVTHNPPGDNGHVMTVLVDGDRTFHLADLKPLTLQGTSHNIAVTLPESADLAKFERANTGGQFIVSSPSNTFELTTVDIPSQMFMLNAGDGDDMVELLDDTGLSLTTPVMVHGDQGSDTFDARQFPHLVQLFGDAGDDVFQFATPMFEKIDGGDGMDVVELVGADAMLDVTALADDQLVGVERLDIRGKGANSLRLNADKVQSLAGDHGAIDVWADADDVVELGDGWRVASVEVRDNRFYRNIEQTGGGNAVVSLSGPHDWQNPVFRLDVNRDGEISPIDALLGINELNIPQYSGADRRLYDAKSLPAFPMRFVDVNGDGFISPIDVALVIIDLNRRSITNGESVVATNDLNEIAQRAEQTLGSQNTSIAGVIGLLDTQWMVPDISLRRAEVVRRPTSHVNWRFDHAISALVALRTGDALPEHDSLFHDSIVDRLWKHIRPQNESKIPFRSEIKLLLHRGALKSALD